MLRKKDFVDRVVERSGLKKKTVKPTVEAALAVLGDALSDGEVLQLPPLGKMQVNRSKDIENGEVLICKLRRKSAVAPTLADPK